MFQNDESKVKTEEPVGEYFEYSIDIDYESYYNDEDDDYEPKSKKSRKSAKKRSTCQQNKSEHDNLKQSKENEGHVSQGMNRVYSKHGELCL